MMASNPGPPKRPEPSFRETAAACVALADLVMGLVQFDSVDGAADDAGLEMVVLGAGDGVSPVGETLGSGARVGTGAGAGATGAGGGAGGSIAGADDVCVGDGVGVSSGPLLSSRQIRLQLLDGVSPSSACAGTAAGRPTRSARTAAAAAADTSRRTDEDRIMVTFSTARGTPSATKQCFR